MMPNDRQHQEAVETVLAGMSDDELAAQLDAVTRFSLHKCGPNSCAIMREVIRRWLATIASVEG